MQNFLSMKTHNFWRMSLLNVVGHDLDRVHHVGLRQRNKIQITGRNAVLAVAALITDRFHEVRSL